MVNCACAVEALSWRAISGSDGRYMSVVSGPIALNAASNVVSANVPGRSMGRIGLSRYPGPGPAGRMTNLVREQEASANPGRSDEDLRHGHPARPWRGPCADKCSQPAARIDASDTSR